MAWGQKSLFLPPPLPGQSPQSPHCVPTVVQLNSCNTPLRPGSSRGTLPMGVCVSILNGSGGALDRKRGAAVLSVRADW